MQRVRLKNGKIVWESVTVKGIRLSQDGAPERARGLVKCQNPMDAEKILEVSTEEKPAQWERLRLSSEN